MRSWNLLDFIIDYELKIQNFVQRVVIIII